MNHLARQARTRRNLAKAVSEYMKLRAGVGEYTDTVHTSDRDGRRVVVFLRLDIVSEEVLDEG